MLVSGFDKKSSSEVSITRVAVRMTASSPLWLLFSVALRAVRDAWYYDLKYSDLIGIATPMLLWERFQRCDYARSNDSCFLGQSYFHFPGVFGLLSCCVATMFSCGNCNAVPSEETQPDSCLLEMAGKCVVVGLFSVIIEELARVY